MKFWSLFDNSKETTSQKPIDPKKVALTGATGFLGSEIAKHLLESGYSLNCLVRKSSRDRIWSNPSQNIEWITGDLNDPKSLSALISGCNFVIHSAIEWIGKGHRDTQNDVVKFCEANLMSSIRLIDLAAKSGVGKFIFVSTEAALGRRHDLDLPLNENYPIWPTHPYGALKAAVDMFVHSYGFGGLLDICSFRPSAIYGLRQPARKSKWYRIVRRIVEGEDVECHRINHEIHAGDAAKAIELLLNSENTAGQAFHCYDIVVSEVEIAELAKQMCNSPSQIIDNTTPLSPNINCDKIVELGLGKLGGRAKLEETVGTMVDIAQQHFEYKKKLQSEQH